MCGSPAPPPPDYGPIIAASAAASNEATALAREQFQWAKDTYAADKTVADRVTNEFLDTMEKANNNADKDRQRYEEVFQPLEDQLVNDANTYATDERRAQEAGRAKAGVAQEYEAKRKAATRELEGYGINPSATRFAALDLGVRADQAAAEAAAADTAGRAVDDRAMALRSEALAIGRGLPNQVIAENASGGSAGGNAAGVTNNSTTVGAGTMGTGTQWNSAANGALGNWTNALTSNYNAQLAQNKANNEANSGWGTALGMIGGVGLKALTGGMMPTGLLYDKGGPVPRVASPTMGAIPDDVPAKLTAGEFVVPRDVVSWFGEKHMHGLIEKAAKERGEAIPTR